MDGVRAASRSVLDETGRRHWTWIGDAARLRNRANMATAAGRQKRDSAHREIRGRRPRLQDRRPNSALRWLGRYIQCRRLDGAEGTAKGRRLHYFRHGCGYAGAQRRRVAAARTRRPDRQRCSDRVRYRRRRGNCRDGAIVARPRSAPGVAFLYSRQAYQSGVGLCVDRAFAQGAQSCGGHRLFDRRACDRRCRPADCAGRCRRHGGGR